MVSDTLIGIIIIIILFAYPFYIEFFGGKSNYGVPPEYRGVEGLEYIKNERPAELTQAKYLCENQFKGNWVNTASNIGCYNMVGFSEQYCNLGEIKNLVNLCNSIGGTPICSSTQASCTV